jgi:hypothetical protein
MKRHKYIKKLYMFIFVSNLIEWICIYFTNLFDSIKNNKQKKTIFAKITPINDDYDIENRIIKNSNHLKNRNKFINYKYNDNKYNDTNIFEKINESIIKNNNNSKNIKIKIE